MAALTTGSGNENRSRSGMTPGSSQSVFVPQRFMKWTLAAWEVFRYRTLSSFLHMGHPPGRSDPESGLSQGLQTCLRQRRTKKIKLCNNPKKSRMSESLEQRVEAAIFASLPGTEPVSRATLSKAAMPSGVRHFLLQTLDRRVLLEANRLTESLPGWIDSTHPEVHRLGDDLADRLCGAGQFPADEWRNAVPQAVSVLMAYLQQPASAMASFAFSTDTSSLPVSDLLRRTGYFIEYPYMAKAVEAWLAQRAAPQIDRTAFETAMHRLDSRLTADYSVEAWTALLQPLIDMVRFAGIQPDGLPVAMAIRFFEAKGRSGIAAAIHAAATRYNARMVTMASLQDIIGQALDPTDNPLTEPPADRPTESGSDGDETPSYAGQPPQAGSDSMPLWKRFQQRVDSSTPSDNENRPLGHSDPSIQPLWKSFGQQQPGQSRGSQVPSGKPTDVQGGRGATKKPQAVSLDRIPPLDLQQVVLGAGIRFRDRYIRDLFEGDEAAFNAVIEDLSSAADWTAASAIIAEHIFRPYQIDIYSDVAVDFTNAVEARYSGHPS